MKRCAQSSLFVVCISFLIGLPRWNDMNCDETFGWSSLVFGPNVRYRNYAGFFGGYVVRLRG